jgi:hypothetical protein
MALADAGCDEPGVGLGFPAHVADVFAREAQQCLSGAPRVDDRAAEEEGRCAGNREQGGRYEAARRRLGDRHRLPPFAQRGADAGGEHGERLQFGRRCGAHGVFRSVPPGCRTYAGARSWLAVLP